MSTSNMRALMNDVLKLMADNGATASTIDFYKTTGFGALVRYSESIGVNDFSESLINEFLCKSRTELEQRRISRSKFDTMRRGCDLLTSYCMTGDTDFKRKNWRTKPNKSGMRIIMSGVLKQLADNGAKDYMLKEYRVTGLGAVVRYFESIGESDFSESIIETFLYMTRIEYEQHKISQWKWMHIRRGCDLIKSYYKTGQADFRRVSHTWNTLHNPVNRIPTKEEVLQHDNILTMGEQLKQQWCDFGFANNTMCLYMRLLRKIVRFYLEHNQTTYSSELTDEFVKHAEILQVTGKMCINEYKILRHIASQLKVLCLTGKATWQKYIAPGIRCLNEYYKELLDSYIKEREKEGNISPSTIKKHKYHIRWFLLLLEDNNFHSFQNATLQDISNIINELFKLHSGSIPNINSILKQFCRYIHTCGITDLDYGVAIPRTSSKHRGVAIGFNNSEITTLLELPNKATIVGKRDYAIMLLAKQTGLRACDVGNLHRQSIDWHTKEIHIVQVKTGVPLTLPLPIESGNAIAEYLLNARPVSDLPNIFVTARRPYRPVTNKSMAEIVARYIKKLSGSRKKRLGFHSFRRSFSKQLLECDTPADLISEILGQTDVDSLKPYIAIDEIGLQSCALGLLHEDIVGEAK